MKCCIAMHNMFIVDNLGYGFNVNRYIFVLYPSENFQIHVFHFTQFVVFLVLIELLSIVLRREKIN